MAELESKVESLEKEKGHILENSIKEITEQKVHLDELQREKAVMEKEALERERELLEAEKVSTCKRYIFYNYFCG